MNVSVVIPMLNGGTASRDCLLAIARSTVPALEIIVVDDGSTDHSAAIAVEMGAKVLSTGGPFGPAHARNLGALHARGDLLLFVDADVVIHPDTLERFTNAFKSDPTLDALIGSYDDAPSGAGFVSQFKNLQHSFVHHQGNRHPFSFWCGCGAIRRSVFMAHGGLDESYKTASIEDIELGLRLRRAGCNLALDPQIQCKHLKVWTLWSLIHTDVMKRAIPWTALILRTRFLPNDLNLRWSQRISVILSAIAVVLGFVELVQPSPRYLATLLAAIASIFFLNRRFYVFLASRKGAGFALGAMCLHILYFVYSGAAFAGGIALFAVRASHPNTAGASLTASAKT